MSQIILDVGSGNTCRNDIAYAKCMIDTVADMDTKKHEIVFKWQLEGNPAPPNKPLDHEVFTAAHKYAAQKGYQTTSSVFDRESLIFLFQHQIPFVKIACKSKHQDCYPLIDIIARGIRVYVSFDCRDKQAYQFANAEVLACIPEYPAKLIDYRPAWYAYSDHVPGLELWNSVYHHLPHEDNPKIWEKHFVLERSKDNPDSGVFALTPDQLAEVIG